MIRVIVSELSPAAIRKEIRGFFNNGGDQHLDKRMLAWGKYQGKGNILKEEVGQYFPDWFLQSLKLPICIQNPARKIVNSRFISYRLPPERTVSDQLGAVEHKLDTAMRKLELSVGVLGQDALLIRWDDDDARFNYFVLQKYIQIYLPGDLEPAGVAYPLHSPDKQKDSACRWAVWTDKLSFYIEGGGDQVTQNDDGTEDNPWGVLPVLFAHRDDEDSDILSDVLNAQAWHNYTMTYAGHAGLLQGMGVPWKSGRPPQEGQTEAVGPYNLQYTEAGGFGFATPGIDLEKLPALSKEYLNSVAFSHHLQLNWAGESKATSGEHQRLLEADLSIAVQADNLKWAEFEKNRVETERIIAQANNINTGPDDFGVNFRESHLPMSENERYDLWKKEHDSGLATRADYFQRRDPDLGKVEAEEKVQELDESRRALNEITEPKPPRASGLLDALRQES